MHELLDFGVLVLVVAETALSLRVSEGSDVGVGDVVAYGIANGVDPSNRAAEHLGELVGLRALCQRTSDMCKLA